MKKESKTFISMPHAAAMKGVDVRTFARHVYRDNVRVFKIGRKLFILRVDLEKWRKG